MKIKKDINNVNDKSYKEFLSNKEVFVDMMSTFVKTKWSKELDVDRLVLIDKEFILSDYEEIESDIIYKANYGKEQVYFYVLMELQSKVDYSMPIRLFMYINGVYREIIKNTQMKLIKKKGYKLPPVVPVVLYNGERNWTAERRFKNIVSHSEAFSNNIIDFEYLLLDVNRYDKEDLIKNANISSAIFMLDQKVGIKEFLNRMTEITKSFKKLPQKHKELIKNWLRNTLSEEFKGKYKIEKIIDLSYEEAESMTSNIYKTLKEEFDSARENGVKQGIERGIEQGIEQGMEIIVLKLLKKKFDITKADEEKVRALKEEKLEALAEAILDFEVKDDLDKFLG